MLDRQASMECRSFFNNACLNVMKIAYGSQDLQRLSGAKAHLWQQLVGHGNEQGASKLGLDWVNGRQKPTIN